MSAPRTSRDQDTIARAKGRLMRVLGIDEPQAYRLLRDRAMSTRQTVAEAAFDFLGAPADQGTLLRMRRRSR